MNNEEMKDLVAVAITTNDHPKLVYVMELADAMKFCSDERTKGKGQTWMFFFTALENYTDEKGKLKTKAIKKDNGFLDEVIDELELKKYSIEDLKKVDLSGLSDHIEQDTYERAWAKLEANTEWMEMNNERERKRLERIVNS